MYASYVKERWMWKPLSDVEVVPGGFDGGASTGQSTFRLKQWAMPLLLNWRKYEFYAFQAPGLNLHSKSDVHIVRAYCWQSRTRQNLISNRPSITGKEVGLALSLFNGKSARSKPWKMLIIAWKCIGLSGQ